jgi:ABC-type multidrug transport system ATPase subunit
MQQRITFEVENLIILQGKSRITNVNFRLESGDIMGLVGRSGSGKSTLLKGLLGKVNVTGGNIRVRVDDIPSQLNSVVGYSPQENSLYPYLTLEENLWTFGKLYGINGKEIRENMGALLARLDLVQCRCKLINEMSGGMQKRADLASSLIHNPSIIMLDEPFNGLDISLQRFIWEFLRQLAASGKIIIISSHMLTDIQKNCTQLGLVEKGTFYNTTQIRGIQGMTRLDDFLEKLFRSDMMSEAR